jgi:RND family efflux transporter MFP subunit
MEAAMATATKEININNLMSTKHTFMLALLAVPLLLAGCKEDIAKVEQPAPVRIATVAFESAQTSRKYTGVVRARFESDLGFRVPGKIVERNVDTGDTVKAGQVIAKLDATDFKLNLEAQEAELVAAKSSRDVAVAAEGRYKILKDKGWVAQAALDQRTSAADEARARVDRAERALSVQRNQVRYAELRADHDGIVASLQAEAGQVVAAGQVIARVARLDELEVSVAIPEQQLAEIKGAQASAELWPAAEKQYSTVLREVAAKADDASRTFEARFTIRNPDDSVRLGKTANIVLSTSSIQQLVRLPLSAVMSDAKGALVWVVNAAGDRVERRPVGVRAFEQETALVDRGLTGGERVVTLGAHMLYENKPIRIVESKSLASAEAPGAQ